MCTALSISRRNVLTKKTRSTYWADLRKSPPRADDADLKDALPALSKIELLMAIGAFGLVEDRRPPDQPQVGLSGHAT